VREEENKNAHMIWIMGEKKKILNLYTGKKKKTIRKGRHWVI